MVRIHPVVTVDEDHVFSGGLVQPRVPGGGDAPVGLVDDPDPGILCSPGVAEGWTAVRGAVVYEQQLKVLLGLAQDALYADIEIILNLEDRDNDADFWCFVWDRLASGGGL